MLVLVLIKVEEEVEVGKVEEEDKEDEEDDEDKVDDEDDEVIVLLLLVEVVELLALVVATEEDVGVAVVLVVEDVLGTTTALEMLVVDVVVGSTTGVEVEVGASCVVVVTSRDELVENNAVVLHELTGWCGRRCHRVS